MLSLLLRHFHNFLENLKGYKGLGNGWVTIFNGYQYKKTPQPRSLKLVDEPAEDGEEILLFVEFRTWDLESQQIKLNRIKNEVHQHIYFRFLLQFFYFEI